MILLTKLGKQIVNKVCGAIIELLNNFDIEFLMHLHPLDLFTDFSVNDSGFSFLRAYLVGKISVSVTLWKVIFLLLLDTALKCSKSDKG
ncbi:hypothetical protein [Obesumbacterium proteus]|uniref:hypothetical protein n=1 Tax=Obesumbacterium proteus TaxID=82983 RepID=UPI00242D224F|nr:hypothetical protein [Obesumbacterium proteus]